jgi:hypothetical protein
MGHPSPVHSPGRSRPRPSHSFGGVVMNQRPGPYVPAYYELRIEGHLDEHWSAWFGRLTVIPEDDGTTTLRGMVTDQAELHGLLAKVRDIGTTLISVKTIVKTIDTGGLT